MQVNLHAPRINRGKCARKVLIQEATPDGLGQSIELDIWVTPDDSITTLSERARQEAIGFLDRALAVLRGDSAPEG